MSENTPDRLKEFRAGNEKHRRPGMNMAVLNTCLFLLGLAAMFGLFMHFSARPGDTAAQPGRPGGLDAELLRKYAGYLADKKLPEAAIVAYEDYLDRAALDSEARANVCFSVAKLAIETESHDKALALLYQAEMLAPQSTLKEEIDKKIVLCLDKLGRTVDLRKELRKRTTVARSAEDVEPGEKVLAEFAGQVITDRDLDIELERMPASARESFATPERKEELLKNIVAERLLLDKAFRLELDKDPEVQEQLASVRDGILVRMLIEREINEKISITPEDVKRFYEAEKQLFTEPETREAVVGKGDSADAARQELDRLLQAGDKQAPRVTLRGGRLVRGLGVTDSDDAVTKAVTAAEPGKASEPIQIGDAWYAFFVSMTPEKVRPFEEVSAQAERQYRARKEQEQFGLLVNETLKARDVELHMDRLQEASGK